MGGGPGQVEIFIMFYPFGDVDVDGGVSGCVNGGGLKLIIIKLSSHWWRG